MSIGWRIWIADIHTHEIITRGYYIVSISIPVDMKLHHIHIQRYLPISVPTAIPTWLHGMGCRGRWPREGRWPRPMERGKQPAVVRRRRSAEGVWGRNSREVIGIGGGKPGSWRWGYTMALWNSVDRLVFFLFGKLTRRTSSDVVWWEVQGNGSALFLFSVCLIFNKILFGYSYTHGLNNIRKNKKNDLFEFKLIQSHSIHMD
jgi:hypothetical protein